MQSTDCQANVNSVAQQARGQQLTQKQAAVAAPVEQKPKGHVIHLLSPALPFKQQQKAHSFPCCSPPFACQSCLSKSSKWQMALLGALSHSACCSSSRSSSQNGTVAPLHPELVSKPRRRTGDPDNELTHPLLGDEPTLQLMPNRNDVVGIGGRREKKKGFLDWWFSSRPKPMRMTNTAPR